jgi:diacylglycerol kinase family enzyme
VAVGGDGTLDAVANGVLGAQRGLGGETAVGFIAEGTGGDFRKSLGLSHRLDRYLGAIASGHERRVDAVRASFTMPDGTRAVRWVVNILSVGLGGLVDRYVVDAPRVLTPRAAYLWSSVRAIAGGEPARLRCVIVNDGERTEHVLEAWTLAVCNGTTFGAGMRIAPMAAVDDGKLEIVALSAPNKLALAALSRRLYSGTHVGEPGVFHASGERVEIELAQGAPERPVFLDVDGEPIGQVPVWVEIVPGALRMRA